jgi:signal transduction histidine kinase
MELGRTANRQELFEKLAKGFDATLITELIPGIIHNFANPLNGIMGRATLLQRRTVDQVAKIRDLYPEMPAEIVRSLDKILQDTDSIVKETDRFFTIFRDLSVKFSAIAPREEEKIDLSLLIASEMRFADFYLDFKHEVKKTLSLEEKLPEITGVYAIYSLCISALLRVSMRGMRKSANKEFSIATTHDERVVVIDIRDTGAPFCYGAGQGGGRSGPGPCVLSDAEGTDPDFLDVVAILENGGARIRIDRKGEVNSIAIEIPIARVSSATD